MYPSGRTLTLPNVVFNIVDENKGPPGSFRHLSAPDQRELLWGNNTGWSDYLVLALYQILLVA